MPDLKTRFCQECGGKVDGKFCQTCGVGIGIEKHATAHVSPVQVIVQQANETKKGRNSLFLMAGIAFSFLIVVNLIASLVFPPIFIQFVVCMVPSALLAAVFFAAWAFKV